MKEYNAFPETPALLEPHHLIALCDIQDTRCGWGGVLSLCINTVGVFCGSSRLVHLQLFFYLDMLGTSI